MKKPTLQSVEIKDFILENVTDHPQAIAAVTAEKFGLSRQAVLHHIHFLIDAGLLSFVGTTRDRRYSLTRIIDYFKSFPIKGLQEDKVWRDEVRPQLGDVAKNVLDICGYGFTEMVNNAIDHSESEELVIQLKRTAIDIEMTIIDNGIGIFNKIQKELDLEDPMYAILELAKGKLTTDPKHHTGEGIFFSSRMFDFYAIWSGNLYFAHLGEPEVIGGNDWLFEDKEDKVQGTIVSMRIKSKSVRTTKSVFDYFAVGDDFGFSKTTVPVFLAQYGNENLISRSQAKRLLTRFERFKEIVLDFKSVDLIGQAFADEIFRVFQSEHPKIRLMPINTNEEVTRMIQRALEVNKTS